MDWSKLNQQQKAINMATKLTFAERLKSNSTVKNIKAYILYYLKTSTIHGVKYIGEAGRYLIEKVSWFCVIVAVCSFCLILINQTYIKWKRSPVIVSLETRERPMFEIPFPAVTVCPEIKIDQEYFNITNYILKRIERVNITEKEHKLFQASLLVCNEVLNYAAENGIKINTNFIDPDIIDELFKYPPLPFLENKTEYQFLGKPVRDDDISDTLTQDGVCYTFNMLPYEDILYHIEDFIKNKSNPNIKVKSWSLEDGYPAEDTLDSYPRRTFLSGVEGGLTLNALYTNHSQIDYRCQNALHGFKVALHHPSELPNMDKYFRLPLNQAVLVAIKPNMITVSNELINYRPEDRRCYFAKEKPLYQYKIYTQQNCLFECFTNYTLKHCGCLPFWLQHIDDVPICGPGKSTCIKKSKVAYLRHNRNSKLGQCDCLPLCTSLSYDIETSYTNWNWRELFKIRRALNLSIVDLDPQMAHFSKLIVYYKDLQFLTSRRHEIYGVIDFFSNIGGLLGLFIGFSVISAVEIIYVLTLRIVCNVKKYGRRYWSGEPQLVNT